MRQITSADLLPQDEAERLGVTADALDQYDQMRAIERCDELVQQLRSLQLLHSQNLCRVANHLEADLAVKDKLRAADLAALDPPLHEHDRYKPHSHEVRPDHDGVTKR